LIAAGDRLRRWGQRPGRGRSRRRVRPRPRRCRRTCRRADQERGRRSRPFLLQLDDHGVAGVRALRVQPSTIPPAAVEFRAWEHQDRPGPSRPYPPSPVAIEKTGAGEGNRTLVISLEGCCSTIELHPHRERFSRAPRQSCRNTTCQSGFRSIAIVAERRLTPVRSAVTPRGRGPRQTSDQTRMTQKQSESAPRI
jgi:hypothetical protein